MNLAHRENILQQLGIDEEIYAELCTVFVGLATEKGREFANAAARHDYETAAKCAHSIKGSAANLGIDSIAAAAAECEQAAHAGSDLTTVCATLMALLE